LIRDKYGNKDEEINFVVFLSTGLWTLMIAVGRKSLAIYVDEMKKLVLLNI